MNKHDALRARWQWKDKPEFAPLNAAFERSLSSIDQIERKRASLAEKGTLSELGVSQALRDFAKDAVVPDLRRGLWAAEKAAESAKAQRRALAVTPPDKTDIVAAMIRAESRTHLRSLSQPDRIALMMSDPAFAEAAFEGPAALSGLTSETRTDLEARMIDAAHGPAVRLIEETIEAADQVASATQIAADALKQIGGFANDAEFGAFMTASSAAVEAEIAAEKAKSVKAPTSAEAITAPFNPDTDMSQTINRVFAKLKSVSGEQIWDESGLLRAAA